MEDTELSAYDLAVKLGAIRIAKDLPADLSSNKDSCDRIVALS